MTETALIKCGDVCVNKRERTFRLYPSHLHCFFLILSLSTALIFGIIIRQTTSHNMAETFRATAEHTHNYGSQIIIEPETLELLPPAGIIRLEGSEVPAAEISNRIDASTESATDRHIRWDDSVVDNEHMNRKKSKICCIFRKQRAFDESSSGESSTSEDSSDSDSSHDERCPHHRRRRARRVRDPSPNAYEKAPKYGRERKPQSSQPSQPSQPSPCTA
jgi:protein phosphatase 1 regulatory subunit 11